MAKSRGVLVHGLRNTFATGVGNENVTVHTLMKLLGHESMVTSQRYVDGSGTKHREDAGRNSLYELLTPRGPVCRTGLIERTARHPPPTIELLSAAAMFEENALA